MSQPAIFVIDGDGRVTAALREDLDRRFGEDFRVIGESSADSGLAALRKLADEGELVALLIVDHDLSEMPGVEFLARAREMHTLAKRVLLVERDYSARSPVISAMTLGQADYHLAKPLPEAVQRRWGYIVTGREVACGGQWPLDREPLLLETSMPGVFAVGDVRYRSIKRVASAVGDGATAVRLVHEYLTAEPADEPALAAGT